MWVNCHKDACLRGQQALFNSTLLIALHGYVSTSMPGSCHLVVLLLSSFPWGHENGDNEELGYGEGAVFSAKCWDRRSREDLIESGIPCHDTPALRLYLGSDPVHLTVLAT